MTEAADIRRLLDAFENSDWQEIRLSVDGTEVLISASDNDASLAPSNTMPAARATASQVDNSATPLSSAQQPSSELQQSPNLPDIPEGYAITSPSPGIFWRSPAPGAPPFVEVGQHVEADTAVCIVEVMKLMNRVTAGVNGTVTAIVVGNSEKVARQQTLIVVTPD